MSSSLVYYRRQVFVYSNDPEQQSNPAHVRIKTYGTAEKIHSLSIMLGCYYFFTILTLFFSLHLSPLDPGSMTNVTGREDRQSYQAQRLVLGGCERAVYPSGQKFQAGLNAPFIFPEGLSSIETLLTNIQVRLQANCLPLLLIR